MNDRPRYLVIILDPVVTLVGHFVRVLIPHSASVVYAVRIFEYAGLRKRSSKNDRRDPHDDGDDDECYYFVRTNQTVAVDLGRDPGYSNATSTYLSKLYCW